MSEHYFGGVVREPSNTIELPWEDRIRVVVGVWVRVNGVIFREGAGAFVIDRERNVLVFGAFKIQKYDEVLMGGTSIHILEALAKAAQD